MTLVTSVWDVLPGRTGNGAFDKSKPLVDYSKRRNVWMKSKGRVPFVVKYCRRGYWFASDVELETVVGGSEIGRKEDEVGETEELTRTCVVR